MLQLTANHRCNKLQRECLPYGDKPVRTLYARDVAYTDLNDEPGRRRGRTLRARHARDRIRIEAS